MLRMAQVRPRRPRRTTSAPATARSRSPRRSTSARARWASSTTRTWRSTRRATSSRPASPARARIVQGDIFATDFQPGDRGHDVPAAGAQPEAAADAPRDAARARASSRTPSPWRTGSPTRSRAWTGGAPISGWCRRTSAAAGRSRPAARRLELAFEQRFQKIEGTVGLGHTQGGLRDARLQRRQHQLRLRGQHAACGATSPAASPAAGWKAAGPRRQRRRGAALERDEER